LPGGTAQLTATTNPAGLTVTWASGNDDVVTVDDTGLVTASLTNTGVVQVTASVEIDGETYTRRCRVVVKNPSIEWFDSGIGALEGTTETADVSVYPSDAVDYVAYTSSDTSVATVSGDGTEVCAITALAAGTATITATMTYDGETYTDALPLLVSATPTFQLRVDEMHLANGDESNLPYDKLPHSAEPTWASSDENVATVDENGFVTAVADSGTATITATLSVTGYADVTDTCTVIAHAEGWEPSITLSDHSLQLDTTTTTTAQLTATVDPVGETVTWHSSDDNIATVDNAGLVTAQADGTATITAAIELNGGDLYRSDECEVTVEGSSPSS
jgi:uncharacterized protein YjdB